MDAKTLPNVTDVTMADSNDKVNNSSQNNDSLRTFPECSQ